MVEEGIQIIKEVAAQTGLSLDNYLVLSEYAQRIPDGLGGLKRILLQYTLQKPWERLTAKGI